jgi:hypothetical protein
LFYRIPFLFRVWFRQVSLHMKTLSHSEWQIGELDIQRIYVYCWKIYNLFLQALETGRKSRLWRDRIVRLITTYAIALKRGVTFNGRGLIRGRLLLYTCILLIVLVLFPFNNYLSGNFLKFLTIWFLWAEKIYKIWA